ncbi:hypothetical protein SS1G_07970 [Sclerotinia sclerotiorum 1980 UF-70]|uniref:Uncharacterized protein n=2 Tax=Sclerotinia sclerotiorum (strain ATCC 18683 / 1980 / Ss-1) TaxID=665079 RepID=A7ERL6_SCLS1|nr:hypothetical protein SS1G_07970 [Sclerotinia sclerotiorum 1980 UF-70]APA13426.1 hypothetical protein sscle_11g081960 [Sclerotinia sclerotiorum 1980 UF-70]EDN92108.1 hypothetical protein SS1G_07970 [Sclerotinia sclerotiorum 1980 UF-70]
MPIQRAIKPAAEAAAHASRQINAVVVSSGLMQKTVKVRIGKQVWNKHLQKKFNATQHLLVHDPNSSLNTGDVISISPGWRTSKGVHHVVSSIIAPFGKPISERPPIPTAEERIAERERKLTAKDIRKGRWSRWGFDRDPRGIEGGEWYVEGWGKEEVAKADESVNGEEVRLV